MGKIEGPWAVGVGFFDFDQHALQMLGPVVGLVERYLNVLVFQVLFANDPDLAVDADGVVDAGYEEDQPDEGIVINILVLISIEI